MKVTTTCWLKLIKHSLFSFKLGNAAEKMHLYKNEPKKNLLDL